MKMARRVAAFILLVAVIVVIIAWFRHIQHWTAVHTGTINEPGTNQPYYGFWSGFGSDLGEATLVGGVITLVIGLWRHHNCHVERCYRLGRIVEGTPYVACHHHHPAHDGDKRNVPVEQIHLAHAQSKGKQQEPKQHEPV